MNVPASIPSVLAAKVSALKKAGKELRQATTTNARIDALFSFSPALNAIYEYKEDQVQAWPLIRLFKPWEGLIDVLAEAPDLTDHWRHENEVMIRFLCADSAGKLVSACERYLGDHSAMAYLCARLPKILQHQAGLSMNTKQWKDILHLMTRCTLHLIGLVLLNDRKSDVTHGIVQRLDREMYLSLLFCHILDPHTYAEERGDEYYLADVAELLLALGFDNRLSGRAASWAVTQFGPTFVCIGFFKFSELIMKSQRKSYFLAPFGLAVHLLASKDNHDLMVDQHCVTRFCIRIYWSMVQEYGTIGGFAVPGFCSTIATFVLAVLDVVTEPLRRNTVVRGLIEEADLVVLLGSMLLHSRGNGDERLLATIGQHLATLPAQDPALTQQYIKPAWLHVQRCLESCDRVKKSSQELSIRASDQWAANFGRHLGWAAVSDTFLQTNEPYEVELVGYAIHQLEEAQVRDWSRISSFRPWEGLIAALTEAPDRTDSGQHEAEVMIRFLCAVSVGKLVSACETYLGDHSATAYLQTQLPKILQHQAWLSINTKGWKDILHQMRQSALHLICLVLRFDKDLGDERHEMRGLLRMIWRRNDDIPPPHPNTYTEKRGDEYLADVVELLIALNFDNQLSGRAASWAATEFGPSLVCSGFFKFSQLAIESGREHYFLASLALAAHLLASTDNHDLMVDKHRVALFCMDIYWSMAKRSKTIDGTEVAEYSSPIAHFIHTVLDTVKDPRRRNAMMRDLIKEADLVILLGPNVASLMGIH
ncbi:hypothetical protein FS837_003416 [Tulasnella sp. UAMH 9824]|nr:hypothetical protein FS837_003416 [Tulasnella sp. UAMH 9824]